MSRIGYAGNMTIRLLSLLLAVGLCVPAIAQDKENMMGKSAGQILAMGYDKWFKLYTGKYGESTAGMVTANDVYAACLGKATDAKIARLPQSTRVVMQGLRKPMLRFVQAMIDCGYQTTGGGTIWALFGSSANVELEQTLASIVKGPKSGPSIAKLQAEIKGKLAKARKNVEANRKDIESFQEGGYKTAVAALDKGEEMLAQIVSLAKKLKPMQASELLKFCSRMADDASEPFGEGGGK